MRRGWDQAHRPLRIALVTETYPPEVNGVALTVARVAEGLRQRGHDLSGNLILGETACALWQQAHQDLPAPLDGAAIGPFVTIGCGAVIGPRARIAPHASIAEGARIGADALILHGARIMARVMIGARFICHPGAVIGADGFSFVTPEKSGVEEVRETLGERSEIRQQSWARIHSLGAVSIGDDVELGANVCIDRGTIRDTVMYSLRAGEWPEAKAQLLYLQSLHA